MCFPAFAKATAGRREALSPPADLSADLSAEV